MRCCWVACIALLGCNGVDVADDQAGARDSGGSHFPADAQASEHDAAAAEVLPDMAFESPDELVDATPDKSDEAEPDAAPDSEQPEAEPDTAMEAETPCGGGCPAGMYCSPMGCECNPGRANCDGTSSNGCEVDLLTNPHHCGSCGTLCAILPHPGSCPFSGTCVNGMCSSTGCALPYADCDGNAPNGCETNLMQNANHCGACGVACSPPHATGACDACVCGIGQCDAGWADCDGDYATGCETQLSNDASACPVCKPLVHRGTVTNPSGECHATTADCNGLQADGCEIDLLNDVFNCGGCNKRCSDAYVTTDLSLPKWCNQGACSLTANGCALDHGLGWAPCDPSGGGDCRNLASDPMNCGGCDCACASGQTCTAGVCQ